MGRSSETRRDERRRCDVGVGRNYQNDAKKKQEEENKEEECAEEGDKKQDEEKPKRVLDVRCETRGVCTRMRAFVCVCVCVWIGSFGVCSLGGPW